MICFRCKKYINEEEDYYSFNEYSKGELVNTNYAHRNCWDEFLRKVGDTTEAMGMLRGLKGQLIKMGMLPPEVVRI